MEKHIEFLFAHWAVPRLIDLRGARWRKLIEQIAPLDSTSPDALALALMMARLNGCVRCNANRYRERGGCGDCSRMVLTSLAKESEPALLARFHAAQIEIAHSLKVIPLEQRAA
jgi:hypothetical protein